MTPTARFTDEKGFTLVELLVVMAVIGLLLGITFLFYPAIAERAKERTDRSNLRILNAVTVAYRAGRPTADPFTIELEDDMLRWEALVPDYLHEQLVPKVKGMAFVFSEVDGRWVYRAGGAGVTPSQHFTVHSSRPEIIGYDGEAGMDIVIPNQINDVTITAITGAGGQGAFQGEGLTNAVLPGTLETIGNHAFRDNSLTSISFPDGMQSIGISAFHDNQLTEIVLPDSVTSVGDHAFHGNHIVRITIGANVAIGNIYSFGEHRPGGERNFDKVYIAHGSAAGTYLWNGMDWIKE